MSKRLKADPAKTAMLAALEPLTDLYGGADEFCAVLQQCGAIIAGGFPLYFAKRPLPLHERTKEELYAFQLCAKAYDAVLPVETFLKPLAMRLQCSEYDHDYCSGDMDVDIYFKLKLRDDSHYPLTRPLLPYIIKEPRYHDFYHQIDTRIFSIWNFNIKGLRVQTIALGFGRFDPTPHSALAVLADFDLVCCKTYFDGSVLHDFVASTSTASMSTKTSTARIISRLDEYDCEIHRLSNLFERYGPKYESVRLLRRQKQALIDKLRARLAKYDRRRFTIAGMKEYAALLDAHSA